MSLKATTTVTEVNGTCGETLDEVYQQSQVSLPEGYYARAFRSPKTGELYLTKNLVVATAISDFQFTPLLILGSVS